MYYFRKENEKFGKVRLCVARKRNKRLRRMRISIRKQLQPPDHVQLKHDERDVLQAIERM